MTCFDLDAAAGKMLLQFGMRQSLQA